MPLQKLVNINPGPDGAHFDPASLVVVAGDIITWSNNDRHNAHWPAVTQTEPFSGEPLPVLMDNRIAAGGQSTEFRPGDTQKTTLYYRCALHHQEKAEIVVDPPGTVPPLPH